MPEDIERKQATATIEPLEEAAVGVAGPIFDFPVGLPGFTEVREFQLLPLGPEFGPYLALKAAGMEHPVFVVAQPAAIAPAFDVEIDDASQAVMGLQSTENVLVLVVITLHGEDTPPTANLAAPIVINLASLRGCQVVQPGADSAQLEVEIKVPVYDPARARDQSSA